MRSRRNFLTSTPLTLLYDPRACSYFLRMYGFWDENLIVSQSQAWESIWRDWLEESSIESRVTNLNSILIFLMVHFLQHKTSNHAIHDLLPSRALCSSLCKIRHVHMFTALLVDVNWVVLTSWCKCETPAPSSIWGCKSGKLTGTNRK